MIKLIKALIILPIWIILQIIWIISCLLVVCICMLINADEPRFLDRPTFQSIFNWFYSLKAYFIAFWEKL